VSEGPHPRADQLGSLSTRELLQLMHGEDRRAVDAVAAHLDTVAVAVEAIAGRLRSGGRLHYFGAGTSGRLAAVYGSQELEFPDLHHFDLCANSVRGRLGPWIRRRAL